MRTVFFILFFFQAFLSHGQFPDTGNCIQRRPIDLKVSVKGYDAASMIHIDTSDLAKGFELHVADNQFKIVGFRVYFFAKYGDLYWRDIQGSKATHENLPILKNLKGDEWMEIECVGVNNGMEVFRAISFKIWID